MLGKMTSVIVFLGLILATEALLPSRCFYSGRTKILKCKLARLNKHMKDLEIPPATRSVIVTNNDIEDLEAIKQKIKNLGDLQVLDMSYNNMMDRLRDIVSTNGELEEFYARNNMFRTVHEELFKNNPLLKKVDISNNKITVISSNQFVSNKRLSSVELWANELISIPEDLFRNNKLVETINLSWNKLSDIPENLFRGLTKLKRVMLWKNQLTCLYSSMFKDNSQLQAFHVAINYLTKVPDNIFDNNPQLEDVRMWSNNLECIPKNTFEKNERLDYVNLMLGNEGLPFTLQQRFSTRGKKSIQSMKGRLTMAGNVSCTAPPCEWNPETKTMDCSGRELTEIQMLSEVCEKVRNLNLNGNKLRDTEMLTPVMAHMRELRTVEFQDNELQGQLNPQVFKNNLELTSADFTGNQLEKVSGTTFEANSILRTVKFGDNRIQEIPEHLLDQNPELSEIDFSRNQIKEIPKNAFSKSRMLTSAKLSNNKITTVDEETFKNNEKLREVDLSNNKLEGEMTSGTFEYATSMERINLKGNRIQNVKKSARHTKQEYVRDLELSFNKLDEFPVAMVEARPKLQRLLLDHNRITTVPDKALFNNAELIELDLSYNRLTKLSNKTFSMNTKLQILRLDNNALTRLEAGWLAQNSELRFFSANGNQIHFISEVFFQNNFLLEEVRLSDNIIRQFPKNLFIFCAKNLRYVTLSKNQLDALPETSFDENDNLEHVCLNGNQLTGLPHPTDIPTSQLQGVVGQYQDGQGQPGAPSDRPIEVIMQVEESSENNFVGKSAVDILRWMIKNQRSGEEN